MSWVFTYIKNPDDISVFGSCGANADNSFKFRIETSDVLGEEIIFCAKKITITLNKNTRTFDADGDYKYPVQFYVAAFILKNRKGITPIDSPAMNSPVLDTTYAKLLKEHSRLSLDAN